MTAYTISRLARMAGVSVRTLHHYDHIGLLKPSARTEAGYRLYEEPDLLRLQQILFLRELDVPLANIQAILDDPGFDQVQALEQHRLLLHRQGERLARLIHTIDKTIERLKEDKMTMTDEELYEGFTREQIERYKREARDMYDPALVAESERRVGRMSREQWAAVKAEGDKVTRALAALADRAPGDPEVQAQVARHYGWLEHFYTPNPEMYRSLGRHYADHPEFRATYDRYRPGLADFMAEAIAYYVDHTLGREGKEA